MRAPSCSRELTPTEFTYAFSLYRDVLCSKFHTRRNKLDDYLSIILNLAVHFGGNGFYQYHTHFASEAAAHLSQFNKATCWGTLDNKIYCQTRVSAFYRLSSAAPPAPKPLKQVSFSPSVIFPITNGINKKGRPILHQGGCFICNNFNSTTCTMFQCFCGGGHACPACPHNPTSLKPGEHLSTPINITVLAEALRNHPDPVFVQFLIKGFEEGFHPRLSTQPSISFEIKNLQSAITELESVDRLLAKEVKEGFMIRLSIHSPFPNFRISPLGITTRK